MKYIKKNIGNWFLNLCRITFLNNTYKVYNSNIINDLQEDRSYYMKEYSLVRTLYNNLKSERQSIHSKHYHTRNGCITIINSPHGNCQTFSIRNCNYLINLQDKKVKEIFLEGFKFTSKKQVLIDIRAVDKVLILKKINSYFNIIFEQEYESSNGSKMIVMLLIKKEKKERKKVVREPIYNNISFHPTMFYARQPINNKVNNVRNIRQLHHKRRR